ncbi:nucleoside/nucleotide kinase family protein [Microlunatus endophyticus]|uniref:Nucleoside/nucleotide kinase family protein n=1 Tax=Microlunatus endophyticus TaxID=1716077 RepID=A0A917S6L1_9ACTN|nr:nucleoside/nucleotide kinase family protein [Microlunatus endophyticus]GGL59514.1 nucleoside/nucleotide kinase family protein [Microlunatus endophyticus]
MSVGTERVEWPGAGSDVLLERATRLLEAGGRRHLLGIAGAPASGKSTLAAELVAELGGSHPGRVALLGMDAFHLAQVILDRRGQAEIKGAPVTFDAVGYLRLLERITGTDETVYAPVFDRGIEDSIAHAVEITPQTSLIITEGNYLLLDDEPWRQVRRALDEAWFIELDEAVRQQRLLQRHLSFGHEPGEARERTYGSDQRNAELINAKLLTPDVWIKHVS